MQSVIVIAVLASVAQAAPTGEEICEGHGFNQTQCEDRRLCCIWDSSYCWSSVGRQPCYYGVIEARSIDKEAAKMIDRALKAWPHYEAELDNAILSKAPKPGRTAQSRRRIGTDEPPPQPPALRRSRRWVVILKACLVSFVIQWLVLAMMKDLTGRSAAEWISHFSGRTPAEWLSHLTGRTATEWVSHFTGRSPSEWGLVLIEWAEAKLPAVARVGGKAWRVIQEIARFLLRTAARALKAAAVGAWLAAAGAWAAAVRAAKEVKAAAKEGRLKTSAASWLSAAATGAKAAAYGAAAVAARAAAAAKAANAAAIAEWNTHSSSSSNSRMEAGIAAIPPDPVHSSSNSRMEAGEAGEAQIDPDPPLPILHNIEPPPTSPPIASPTYPPPAPATYPPTSDFALQLS